MMTYYSLDINTEAPLDHLEYYLALALSIWQASLQLPPLPRNRLPRGRWRSPQSSFWSDEFRLRVLPWPWPLFILSATSVVRDRADIQSLPSPPPQPPSRASPEAHEAGLRVGPGLQSSLFVGIRSICMSLATLVLSAAAAVSWERALDGELYSEAMRTRSISNEEIFASSSSASNEAEAPEEAMRRLSSPDWCFDGWYDVLFMILLRLEMLLWVGNGLLQRLTKVMRLLTAPLLKISNELQIIEAE